MKIKDIEVKEGDIVEIGYKEFLGQGFYVGYFKENKGFDKILSSGCDFNLFSTMYLGYDFNLFSTKYYKKGKINFTGGEISFRIKKVQWIRVLAKQSERSINK